MSFTYNYIVLREWESHPRFFLEFIVHDELSGLAGVQTL